MFRVAYIFKQLNMVQIINKAIMGPSTQQFFFSSSDVIATTCFDHTTIIKRQTELSR
jgi:hypothetical protein